MAVTTYAAILTQSEYKLLLPVHVDCQSFPMSL
jgi:hypothetical protein